MRELLLEVKERFPDWFSQRVEEFGEISARLAEQRGPSLYGDEERGITPYLLFGKEEAEKALEGARTVYSNCRRLIEEFLRSKSAS